MMLFHVESKKGNDSCIHIGAYEGCHILGYKQNNK